MERRRRYTDNGASKAKAVDERSEEDSGQVPGGTIAKPIPAATADSLGANMRKDLR